MSAEPFGTWLRRQANRDDWVGDLARDFRDGGSRAYTSSGVREDMRRHGARGNAWRALEQAVREWEAL